MMDWILLLIYACFTVYCFYRIKQLSGDHRTFMIVLAVLWSTLTGWKLTTLILQQI